jgi:tripartite-type tricarboxylate transporter receptor subunit TctC
VSGSTRLTALPDVPSIAEAGFPGVNLDTWFGMVAPAGTPDAIIGRLHAELAKAVHDPNVEARMYNDAVQPRTSSPAEFAALIASDIKRLAKLAKELGAKGD